MAEEKGKKTENGTVDNDGQPQVDTEPKATSLEVHEGKGKKAVKWLLRGLAGLAAGAAGFFIGRASVKSGDDDDDDKTDSDDNNND